MTPSRSRAALYAALHTGTPGDLALYRRHVFAGSAVLELGCGTGRVLRELAPRVDRLVGVDLDEDRLGLAREALAATTTATGRAIELHRGDMRSLDLGERFDRVLVPHSGILCMLDDAAVVAALSTARRHLAPDGLLVLDAYRADAFHHTQRPADHPEDELTPVARLEVEGRGFAVLERSRWDRATQRIDVTYVHVPEDGGDAIETVIAQRYLLLPQLRRLADRAGLRVVHLHPGFEAPNADAPNFVLIATPKS